MRKLGIYKTYEIKKTVSKDLILNDKVVDLVYNYVQKEKKDGNIYVLKRPATSIKELEDGYKGYVELTRDVIRDLLKGNLDKDCIAVLDNYYDEEDDEYGHGPFATYFTSAYEGDYDRTLEVEYEYCIMDLIYERDPWKKPDFVKHPEKYDWKEEVVTYSDERLVDEDDSATAEGTRSAQDRILDLFAAREAAVKKMKETGRN